MIDIASLLKSKQESTSIEFKSEFVVSDLAWLEIIKDIVGIANSGGGHILFGFDSSGELSKKDVSFVTKIDPADLTNKIHKYTSINFSNFTICSCTHKNYAVGVYAIGSSEYPIIFTNSGTYQKDKGQASAFQRGAIYFRHGAKTEPADNQDIRQFLEKKIQTIKGAWLDGIRQVVEAPEGSVLMVRSKESDVNTLQNIHLTDDPSAPTYRIEDIDITHPLRGRIIYETLNDNFPDKKPLKNSNILNANEYLDVNNNQNFVYRQKDAVIKYTPKYLELLLDKYTKDPEFFNSAKNYCIRKKREKSNNEVSVATHNRPAA